MNTRSIVSRLLSEFDLKHTDQFISNFLDQTEYPDSPESVIALLENYNIAAMAVKFDSQQLLEVELPILVIQRSAEGSAYAIMESLSETHVTYWTDKKGSETVSPQKFLKQWTGHAVLVDGEEAKDEPNFEVNKNSQISNLIFKVASIAFIVFAITVGARYVFDYGVYKLGLFLLKVTGIVLTYQLVSKSVGSNSSITDAICNFGKNTDCEKVLSSPGSKIFGSSLADIGFVYFLVTGVITFLGLQLPGYHILLYDLSILLLPLTVISIAYQGIKIKSWCPLCLGVSVIIWLEFLVLQKSDLDFVPIDISYMTLMFVTGAVILLFTIYKSHWKSSIKGQAVTRQFQSFKYDDEVMESIIEGGREINTNSTWLKIFQIYPGERIHELIIISDPTCIPCAKMHNELEEFLDEFRDHLSVVAVPFYKMSKDLSSDIAHHMINLANMETENWSDILQSWYSMEVKDSSSFNSWKSKYPIHEQSELPGTVVNWLKSNQLFYTPGFVLNGRLVNPEYKLKDIRKYLINHISEINPVLEGS